MLVLSAPRRGALLILAYCFVASLMPVWVLLQPRGYLGGFVLYLALLVGVVGIFFGGFDDPAAGVQELGRRRGATGALFPFLFVTIACGACSRLPRPGVLGHDVEADRARRSHCRPIGYGAHAARGASSR